MQNLLDIQLDAYTDFWRSLDFKEDHTTVSLMKLLEKDRPQSYFRDYHPGHFTGSALVTDASFSHVLLTLHAKLNMWIQLGGHADGDTDLFEVAKREAWEESGLESLRLFRHDAFNSVGSQWVMPIDIDIHTIPARKSEPEHEHYDVRFLFIADPSEPLTVTSESKQLRWLPISEAMKLTSELSMLRQFAKIDRLRRLTLH